jgi:hypothetical protein
MVSRTLRERRIGLPAMTEDELIKQQDRRGHAGSDDGAAMAAKGPRKTAQAHC